MNLPLRDRKQAIARVKHLLQRHSSPRLQMSMILLATALAGFFCSFLLLQLGMKTMALRYMLAVGFAYGVFLGMLRLWLHRQRRKARENSADTNPLDWIDADIIPSGSGSGTTGSAGFSGGSSGGAGASRSFAPSSGGVFDNVGTGATSGFSFDFDADDLWILALLVAAIGGALIASIYIIVSAPTLLAEIFVDGLLVTGLYKRLLKIDRQQHWLETALWRTWLPVLVVALIFMIAGYFIQQLAPQVDSLGDLFSR